MRRETWHYFRAGRVERGPRYQWREGYARVSAGGLIEYPWLTRREAQSIAKSNGAMAVFHETEADARRAARIDP